MMSAPRKTVKVTYLVDVANHMLAQPLLEKSERVATIMFLESALHEADAYRGFQYTDGNVGDTDATRRRYYGGSHG